MKIPLIIYAVMIFTSVCWSAYKHGQPRTEKYNYWVTLGETAIIVILLLWINGWKLS